MHHIANLPPDLSRTGHSRPYPRVAANFYDIIYGIGGVFAAPWFLARSKTRGKFALALHQRMGQVHVHDAAASSGPCVMIHAVSLGEINATRTLVADLRQRRPGARFIVSTTTSTGFERGTELYGSEKDVSVIYYPLDFSWACERVLDAVRPDIVVLMELEVWPNFVLRCRRRAIPVVLVNGRLTGRSFGRYRLVRPFVAGTFGQLDRVCVQDDLYRERFLALGCRADRIQVTGTMKFDTAAHTPPDAQAVVAFAATMGLHGQRTWVCGSTGPGEESLVLPEYVRLLKTLPLLRLVIVPRKPERFDEVAALIAATGFGVLRRSAVKAGSAAPTQKPQVVLGDTLGELRTFYALAEAVFVGRTLVDLGPRQHGSDMIEPAALGKPVVVGKFTGNFADAMHHFRRAGAIAQVASARELGDRTLRLLQDRSAAATMGQLAREVVSAQQGATARHVDAILAVLDAPR